ncbi:stage V sporulation protein B [Virgibacillus flavescens]|uniref:stage V sporulation protein B n=1 Tax=Virgibacillus flavescens TaxID=1611422 RepID=UPI003D32ED89
MSKQTFLQGTIILIIAGMITRLLGFINRIVVARVMGEEGVGLYMMALPTLFLVITITQLGLPVAISKRVAEADATNNQQKIKKILVVSLIITGCTSLLVSTLLVFIIPFIASSLLNESRTIYPLFAICPIIPIVAVSAVIRGYFQGLQDMKPQSYSQVIEQIVRISCVALFVKLLLPYGIEYAAAGAMISVIIGEIISLSFIIYVFKRRKVIQIRYRFFGYLKSSKDTLRELFSVALPSTGSKMIGSISYFLEPIIVMQSLAIAGIASKLATQQYGELTGYVLPLLFLPTFITQSLSITLVPSISEAGAKQNLNLINYRIHQSIRISFASGALATIVLSLFASPILIYMYGTDHASQFLVLMAPFFLLLYIQAPLQAALQALDLAKPAMWNSLIGACVKFIALFVLASSPQFRIKGVALSMVAGIVLVTSLHLATLLKAIKFFIPFLDICKMAALLLATWWFGSIMKSIYLSMEANLLTLLGIFIILTLIYLILLFTLKFITKEELKQIPLFAKWIQPKK